MVAAERVFQYLELGSSGGDIGGSGSKDGGNSTGSSRSKSPDRPGSSAAGWGAAAGSDLEAQRHPLLAPAAAGLRAEARRISSGSDGSWLHSGHVTFEDVWLRYEPWQAGMEGIHANSSSSDAANGGASCEASGAAGASSGSGSSPWVLRGVSLDISPGKPATALPRVGLQHLSLLANCLAGCNHTQLNANCSVPIMGAPPRPAGNHVGICGRTGAGKSSLLAALLRLTPTSGGRISIDGRDIATIPPEALRRAVGGLNASLRWHVLRRQNCPLHCLRHG
jgi:ABC-type multidrug transport system fused ATPase/permease subunit